MKPRVRFPSSGPTYTHTTQQCTSARMKPRVRFPSPAPTYTHTTQQCTSARLQPRVCFPSSVPTYTHKITVRVRPPATTGPLPVLSFNLHTHKITLRVRPPATTGPLSVLSSNLHTHTTQQCTPARMQPRVRSPSSVPTYTQVPQCGRVFRQTPTQNYFFIEMFSKPQTSNRGVGSKDRLQSDSQNFI